MKLSRRAALALATTTLTCAGVLAPTLAGALPIAPPDGPVIPRPVTTRRPTPTTTLSSFVDPAARYVVQADWVFCNDETGDYNWTGSDEPRFDFISNDETGQQVIAARSFSDVDTGESRSFGFLDVSNAMAGPLTLSVSVREMDWGTPNELIGQQTLVWTPEALAAGSPTVGSVHTEQVSFTGDNSRYTLYLRTKRVA